MASNLNTKINSYSLKRGIEMSETFSLTPTRTGSSTLGTLTQNSTSNITYNSAVGPAYGAGSWSFRAGSTATNSYIGVLSNANLNEGESFADGNYSMGFWFNFSVLPGGTQSSAYGLFRASSTSGYGMQVWVAGTTATGGLASKINITSGGGSWTNTSPTLETNRWYYFAMRRNGTSIDAYLDGTLFATNTTASGTTPITTWSIGSNTGNQDTSVARVNLSNYYTADYSTIDATAINEIWLAGTTSGAVNVTITETPIIVTALQTDPTIVIVDNDHVEITTSITVDATMPSATVTTTSPITISATPITASAEILDHVSTAGTGINQLPQPITASAEMLTSPFIGGGDINAMPNPLTASATADGNSVYVTPNYVNIIQQLTPSLFLTNPNDYQPLDGTNDPYYPVNSGTENWGTPNVTVGFISTPAPAPMSAIGNGRYIIKGGSASSGLDSFELTSTEALARGLEFSTAGTDSTIEFWMYPSADLNNYTEKIIAFGSGHYFQQQVVTELDNNQTYPYLWRRYMTLTYRTPGNVSNTYVPISSGWQSSEGAAVAAYNAYGQFWTTNQWHHVVLTADYSSPTSVTSKIIIDTAVKSTKTSSVASVTPTSTGLKVTLTDGVVKYGINQIAAYKSIISNSDIIEHYNFIATSSPDRTVDATAIEVGASLVNPSFIIVKNKNFPATPVTASLLSVNPSVLAAVGDGYDAELIEVSATMVNPSFYGNPDAAITATALTALADTPQNVYRLDTAYYSYVQTSIAPIRFVTFDVPNSNLDWGSDNDFAQAAPFVYDGTITTSIDGLNNNSLLSTGTDYTTSGLIMKESEWDDDWGTAAGSYHSSYWIKRHTDDTGSNGLRVIQSAYSPIDGSYGILYQQNNLLKMEMFNGTDYFTATSGFNVNVFDYSKHHIVVNFRKTGSNHFVDVYVDKLLAITVNVGIQSLIFKNSDTYLAPNTETNNMARMSVGALIPPIASTSLPVTPTATKMYIDDVHWAGTPITQTGVNNLYAAMPYKLNINWAADKFLSNSSYIIDPVIGTSTGINSEIFAGSAELVNPTLIVDFDRNVNATVVTASAKSIEPFSVIGDTISHVNISSDLFIASAEIGDAVQKTTFSGSTMYASAKFVNAMPYFDPYNILILEQSSVSSSAGYDSYAGYLVGDLD